MVKKPYPPGLRKKKRGRAPSEYGKELREKQKLKKWYNLKEKQFRNYVKEVLEERGGAEDAETILIKKLETRFDNIIFRLGFANSRPKARQMVSHRHFLVNGKTVNIPAYHVKKGDIITVRPSSVKKPIFQNIATDLKKYNPPSWLQMDIKSLEGKVVGYPTFEEVSPPAEVSAIFELYSR